MAAHGQHQSIGRDAAGGWELTSTDRWTRRLAMSGMERTWLPSFEWSNRIMRPTQGFAPLPLRLGNTMASARNAVLHLASLSLAALIRWQQSQRAMTEPAALSDRDLKDLGMHRSHILWVANHG